MTSTPWLFSLRSPQFVSLIIFFTIFSIAVETGLMSTIDSNVAKFFLSLEGSQQFDQLMIGIASLGDIFSLLIVAIVLTIIRRTRKAGLVFLMAIVIISISTMYSENALWKVLSLTFIQTGIAHSQTFFDRR